MGKARINAPQIRSHTAPSSSWCSPTRQSSGQSQASLRLPLTLCVRLHKSHSLWRFYVSVAMQTRLFDGYRVVGDDASNVGPSIRARRLPAADQPADHRVGMLGNGHRGFGPPAPEAYL